MPGNPVTAPGIPAYVPAAYRAWVREAATRTGLPVSVVAAQINTESGFNPKAVSPTGAQGIAQFEPGTWATWGKGSPFNANNSLNAYVGFMKQLLKEEHGNVRNALAAYNAGAGNISAGLGYADHILGAAGQKGGLSIPGAGVVGNVVSSAAGIGRIADTLGKFGEAIDWFFTPNHWIRISAGVGGIIAVTLGAGALAKTGSQSGPAFLPIGVALVGVGGVALFIAFHNLPPEVVDPGTLFAFLADSLHGGKIPA